MESPSTSPPGDSESDLSAVAAEIAKILSEPKAWLIKRIVRTIGAARARAILEKTLQVEAGRRLLPPGASDGWS